MLTITKKLTRLTWYGPTLVLANASWKASAKLVRRLNTGGTGSDSFNPNSGYNALTQVAAGDIVEVEAVSASPSFSIDNGVAPTGGVSLIARFVANSTALAYPLTIPVGAAGTYALDAANPITGLTNVSYAKGGAALTFPAALLAGDVITITGTTAAGADGILTLIQQ